MVPSPCHSSSHTLNLPFILPARPTHIPIPGDDWWYPGHPVYVWCVREWAMVSDAFPSGLKGMHDKLVYVCVSE